MMSSKGKGTNQGNTIAPGSLSVMASKIQRDRRSQKQSISIEQTIGRRDPVIHIMPTPTLHPFSPLIREDLRRNADVVDDRNDEDSDNNSSSSEDNNNDEDHDISGEESQDESYYEDESDDDEHDIGDKNLEGDQTETSSSKPQRKPVRAIPREEWPKDESGRWVLHCVGKGWAPSQAGVDALNDAIMSSYRDAWPTWSLVPEDVKARWWDFFKDRCTWNPIRTDTMKKNWKSRGSKQLSSLLRHARAANKKPDWCGEAAWNDLLTYWSSDKYKLISKQNSKNRGSAKGGALHTTGRASHLDVIEQMVTESIKVISK